MTQNITSNSSVTPNLGKINDIPVNINNVVIEKNNSLLAGKNENVKILSGVIQQVLTELKEQLVLNKPNLPNANFNLDPDTAMVLLMDAYDKQSNQDIKVLVKNLKATLEFRTSVNQEQLKKFEEQIKKQEEETKKRAEQQTLSDVTLGLSIFAAIAGVVASIFTFGLAAPAIAVALVGLGMASLDAANRIVQATDGQYKDPSGKMKNLDISISGLIRMTVESDLHNNPPVDEHGKRLEGKALEDEINRRVLAATIVVNIILISGMIAGGGAGAVMAKEALKSGAKASNSIAAAFKPEIAQLANTGATTAQVGNEVVEGAMGAITNILSAHIASIKYDASETQRFVNLLKDYSEFLYEDIKVNQKTLTAKINDVAQMWETATESNANYYQSQALAINPV